MNITAFISEQIVHDRYLYLPLLGFLMLTIPYLKDLLERFTKGNIEIGLLIAASLISIPLGSKTFFYNQTWSNELAIWEQSIKIDENSSFNWSQLGAELAEKGRFEDAISAYNNAIKIKPISKRLLGRAQSLVQLKRFEEAVPGLQIVRQTNNENVNAYTLYQTYEALAVVYGGQKKFDEAAQILIEARKRLPIYYAALTEKLAFIYYQKNEQQKALAELESARKQAKIEFLPESKNVIFRLGTLYFEAGQKQRSKEALQEYLSLTETLQDNNTLANRKQALELLEQF